jgi:hypothetical protein
MVDASAAFNFERVLENVNKDDHYKFKPFQKEEGELKDRKDNNQWTVLFHYLHLARPVDLAVVKMLINDKQCDVKHSAQQQANAAVVAAKNPTCNMETLEFLASQDVEMNRKDEHQGTVLMYYVRYAQAMDNEICKFLVAKGNDIKAADTNQMTILHYALINKDANADHMAHLVEAGCDADAKMKMDIDCLDLVIYTQN